MAVRDGHSVAAHYGSVATELAVCLKRVGLAVRWDLDTIELTGREPWLAHFLARTLDGDAPAPGRAVALGGTWCCRVAPDRAIVVGPWSAAARWQRCVRQAVVTGTAIACAERSESVTAMTLVGPRVGRLLSDAGFEPDLPVAGVCDCTPTSEPCLLLREGADRYLLVLAAHDAVETWRRLVDAGRSLGLSLVGTEALARLAVAHA